MGSREPRWLSTTEQQTWRAFLRGGRQLMEALDRDLVPYGMCLSEYEIISMLSEAPDHQLRMSELATVVVQSRSRLTHTATRLERRGWVTRAPFPGDGRGVLLTLTEAGLAKVIETAPGQLASVRARLIDQLTPAQIKTLGQIMTTVSEGMEQ